MRRVVAPLAAAVLALAPGGCENGGAEPGASEEATLVLDFTPNAVHSGIYAALSDGAYADAGIELELREPSASADAPKLLEAGAAELAILDIHDLAIARERGADLVGVAALVRRPLAAVIAGDRESVRAPADLEGAAVGVTGLPSDDAVLDSVLAADGADPQAVERVTIGFKAVQVLEAGRLEAATAFWNAEGVALREAGVPTREFRVEGFGAPRYPELVLATSAATLAERPELIEAVIAATRSGYAAVLDDPETGLAALLEAVPALDEQAQRAQLEALIAGNAFDRELALDRAVLERWARWDAEHGIVAEPPEVEQAFALSAAP